MHVAIMIAAAVVPSPTPTRPPDELVTPGPWGFAVIGFIAVAVILLVFDMLRRVRRGRYRDEIRAELDAEEQALAAQQASEADDEDVDPGAPAGPPRN